MMLDEPDTEPPGSGQRRGARAGLWPSRLDGDDVTLVFGIDVGGLPTLLYLGRKLPADEDLGGIAWAVEPIRHGSQPDVPSLASICPGDGRGYAGFPAVCVRRGDAVLSLDLRLASGSHVVGRQALFVLEDDASRVRIVIDWTVGPSDVVTTRATITNFGTAPLAVDHIASIALPLPGWASHMTRFHGRWAAEMHEERAPIAYGRSGGESWGGRPGFGGANWCIAHEAGFGVGHGLGIMVSLGWSGDHQTIIERDSDGARIQMGVRFDPGELVLNAGARFTTPDAVMAVTGNGRNGLRAMLHMHVRHAVLPGRAAWPERRVHLNSWEAVAFGMDEARLVELARAGQAIGAERFVVDDGWFSGRRNDTSSLGDWTPDVGRFPRGLGWLIGQVADLGMDFGLWVEPEMVSPDSDLYRAHPDWCLHRAGMDRPTQRHQLVLDLARDEVSDYLFATLDTLLTAHPIAYLKWDHNREIFPNDGVGYAQTQALYGLIDRLRAAHPAVEIESCASGGGRTDYGILSRCNRVWPSDNNDAIDRLRINRAWSLFLPPEVMGNHVGPSPNPITGRQVEMGFRAKVAMFGHMGVEADPGAMSDAERATLCEHIACYKRYRGLIHAGVLHELAFDDPGLFGTLVVDGGTALALVARTDVAVDYNARPVRFPGLDPGRRYRLEFPLSDPRGWSGKVAGMVLSGRALMDSGLTMPLSRPSTAWLICFQIVDGDE